MPKIKISCLYGAMVLSVVLLVISIFIFSYLNSERIKNRNLQYLITESTILTQKLELIISGGIADISLISQLINTNEITDTMDIHRYQNIIKDSILDKIEFMDEFGMKHSITGESSDAKGKKFFQNVMKGTNGVELLYNPETPTNSMLIFYAPIFSNDHKIIGGVIGSVPVQKNFGKFLDIKYFGEKAITYLADKNGLVIASNDNLTDEKRLSLAKVINADDKISEMLIQKIGMNEDLPFFIDDNQTPAYLIKINSSDLYLMQIFPKHASLEMAKRANKIGIYTILVLLFFVFIPLLVVFHLTYKNQQIKLKNAIKRESEAHQQSISQLKTMTSLSEIYLSMHLIDLKSDKTIEYHANDILRKIINGRNHNVASIMKDVMTATIDPDYLERALEFTDLTTIADRMKNKKFLSAEYIGRHFGWVRGNFITVETDSDGKPTIVIFATQVIDEEKRKEQALLIESNTDQLTGFFNRRSYEDQILEHNDTISEEDFVYVSMDLNGLKIVNDNLGHNAGDELILGAAQCMRQCIGPYGRLFRLGGDEFAAMIFAKETELDNIIKDFKNTIANWSGKYLDSLSIAFGFVPVRETNTKSVKEIAVLADQKMYEAKKHYYQQKGVDRRGVKDVHTAICDQYQNIVKINLLEDCCSLSNENNVSGTGLDDYRNAPKIKSWTDEFIKSFGITIEYQKELKKLLNPVFLKEYFSKGHSSLSYFYERKIEQQIVKGMIEIIPAKNYSENEQFLYAYIRDFNCLSTIKV